MQTATLQATDTSHLGHHFDGFADSVRARFKQVIETNGPHLFTVDAGDLYAIYLDNLPPEERQHHACHCCKQFIERFGNLAIITEDGAIGSPLWGGAEAGLDIPDVYQQSALEMMRAVQRGKITGVFLNADRVWGTPLTGEWTHFSVTPSAEQRFRKSGLLDASQVMAQKGQDFITLSRGVADFKRDILAQAVTLLDADALTRSEKVKGPATFLLDLHDRRAAVGGHGERARNVTWLAVARAPVGFCTPRSGMIGTLLEDLEKGMSFDQVKRRFAEKMAPDQYQRPQAAPTAGNIARAEKVFEELGLARSLERRFARFDEIKTVWTPTPADPAKGQSGVFSHLKQPPEPRPSMTITPVTITWVKFARDVIPLALGMQLYTEPGLSNFGAMVTAVNADAPPLLQWDREDDRNPLSMYVYNGGSAPGHWNLPVANWVDVTGIALMPWMWVGEDAYPNQSKAVMLVLKGARDIDNRELALFPEIIRSDLHEVRATIEAHSRAIKLQGAEDASACGLLIARGGRNNIRVLTRNGAAHYYIDRWE